MGLYTTSKTVQDVLTEVKRTFGDESAVQITDDDILRWINAAQREILINNRILKATGTTDVTGGVSEYDFSTLKVVSIQSIQFKGRKLEYKSFQEAEEYVTSEDPLNTLEGDPILWYEWGGMIHLYPVPADDEVGALKVYYIKEPDKITSVSATLAVPDSYYENIIQFVMAKAYELDEDNENSNYKLGQFNERLGTLSEQDSMPNQSTYPRITILDEDAW